ncbi:MAG: class I SAM-dependent methyltransferase [Burkholderiales bacterium]|nr:class I SAM-dependent methyltransferase [Burkholderiales bacterium]
MSRVVPRPQPCRACGAPLVESVVDLGAQPLANAMIPAGAADRMEPTYPLHAFVCSSCRLMQLVDYETPEAIFSDYTYFSSYSDSWLDHARQYCEVMTRRLALGPASKVVEIASNDGYLLRWFADAGIPVLGVEPAANVAAVASGRGIATEVAFFGRDTAMRLKAAGHAADLMAANNVLAHVPDINDFLAGFAVLLKPRGVATFEFPHVLNLIGQVQFDTIYHEHFSYLSLTVVSGLLQRHGLEVFDVEEWPTHGGSLRVFARPAGAAGEPASPAVAAMLAREAAAGLGGAEAYRAFGRRVVDVKANLLDFLVQAHRAGRAVAGYGAPAKGNTLLNYCGIGPEFVAYTVDRSPHKQGRLLPGTRIPVHAPERIFETRPDYVLILPWNLRDEIAAQMAGIRDWGGQFVVPLPQVEVF